MLVSVARQLGLGNSFARLLCCPAQAELAGKRRLWSAKLTMPLRAYRKAERELVEGPYASVRELAPPHLRVPCHIYVVCCLDGVIVRYDAAGEEEPKMRGSFPASRASRRWLSFSRNK